jgi:transposase-like protein
MDKNIVISFFEELTPSNQAVLLKDLERIKLGTEYSTILKNRGNALDDRSAECPYCESAHYVKNGTDKGSRRYKCRECNSGFTEYTGTWIAGLHKKHLIPGFMKAMELSLSLVKSAVEIGIDSCTVFSWRHKFLSAHENIADEAPFKGITEADDTFYLHSQKGTKCKHRPPRQRGGRPTRGLSKDEAVIFTTVDRIGNIAYKFAAMGRVSLENIERTIGNRVSERTIFCSDGLASYKTFSKQRNLEHYILNASKGERIKGEYHIQHINSLHSRMKNLFNHNLKGVSTKYIQKYVNWQKIRDIFRDKSQWIKTVLALSLQSTKASNVFRAIEMDYFKIYTSPLYSS